MRFRATVFGILALFPLALASGAKAQDANQVQPSSTPSASASQPPVLPGSQRAGSSSSRGNTSASGETRRLPEDSTTKQTITANGRTLSFTATAGLLRLFNQSGDPQADIAYTAYQLDGTDPRSRPVTFFFNGGPGASSAYLQLGCAGPWRLPIEGEGATSSASPELKPNAETWLDFTDMVFVDPVDTGYSRFVSGDGDAHKNFFTVNGDVNALAVVIRRYLEKYDRLLSPKFIVGESYGGIRGPKMVRELQTQQGVGINGLILISPAFDFRDIDGASLLQYVTSLPSMAAIAREARHPVTRADMADVETYARGEFVTDLLKGQADKEATTRLADRVSALTGIDQVVTRRLAGRLGISEFRREFDRRDGKVTGRYDGSVLGFDPDPESSRSYFDDPSGDTLIAPLTTAAVDLTTRTLKWRPDGPYRLLNRSLSWDYGGGRTEVQSMPDVRHILALDPKLKLLIGHGLFDLTTPYFGSKTRLDQLPAYASADRVKLVVYPGGHMFYSREASRRAFRTEAEALMKSDE
ncbi:S10 family peptidase [Bradyrhizobium erythrophlei]|uniref:Carboxypeptidase C (Cathepsin A) n=1 Tax=Bradyrhizobium erythrophlei TaxID=1437360 RepID=A0A1M7ULQ0_9BRAD|nr:peptidase S10 [Bradyrhizobium erythrophlei]SHN83817.1 Carboxypeptidase C (cathepsin A) [Bradyrhizobium erythrophlei]